VVENLANLPGFGGWHRFSAPDDGRFFTFNSIRYPSSTSKTIGYFSHCEDYTLERMKEELAYLPRLEELEGSKRGRS